MIRRFLQVGIAVGSLTLLVACGGGEEPQATADQKAEAATPARTDAVIELSPEAVRNQGIKIDTVNRRRATESKVFPASVEEAANLSANISVPISSRVQEIKVDIGTSVTSGQVLAYLASSELGTAKADLLSAEANLLASESSLIAARQQNEREIYLAGRGISSQREKQESQSQLVAAQARFAGSKAAIKAAEARLLAFGLTETEVTRLEKGENITPRLAVRTPIGGRVIQRKVRVGQVVQPGESLFTVSNLSEVWVILKVFQTDLGRLRVGDDVRFTIRDIGNRTVRGRVLLLSETLDPQTRTADVRVVIPNPERKLKPGMLVQAEVDLGGGSREVLAVPDKALYEVDGKQVVFVRESLTRFRPRTVTIGARTGSYTEITGGLRSGEPIVVDGGFVLKSEMLKS